MSGADERKLGPIPRFIIDRKGLPFSLAPGLSTNFAARLRQEFQDNPQMLAQIDLLTRDDLIRGSYLHPDEEE